MDEREHRLRVSGELERVRAACDFVVNIAQDIGMDEDDVFHCQLSVEEIFTNIVEHGYEHAGDGQPIEIVCTVTDDRLEIALLDNAPLFNPLELDDPDPTTPLWERESDGGWGVYFVRQYMDDIHYSVEEGRNCITLTKQFTSEA